MATPTSVKFRDLKPGFNHKEADTRVLAEMRRSCPPGALDEWVSYNVIRAVVEGCSEFMIPKLELEDIWDARGSELTPYAMEAWRTQSFERLRTIVELQKPGAPELQDDVKILLRWQREATKNSWHIPYEGDAHRVLRDVIRTIEFGPIEKRRGKKDAYANTMSIIQSSGTGKSRMVDQLATIEFVFPFNLREDSTTASFAHPDPDREVRNYFLTKTEGTDKRNIGMYYCAFLISLFEKATEILDKCPLEQRHHIASWWRLYLEKNRLHMYEKVISQSHIIHRNLSTQAREENAVTPLRSEGKFEAISESSKMEPDYVANTVAQLEVGVDAATTTLETTAGFPTTETGSAEVIHGPAKAAEETEVWKAAVALTHEHLGSKRVTEACSALLTKVQTLSNHGDALIVLYFDESHVLHEALDPSETTTPRNTRYTTLCWALDLLADTYGVFSLFLSTNSHVGKKFAPTPALFPSARINADNADHLQAPYTEMPFDCFPKWPIQSGSLSLAQSNEIPHLCQFGRPLFWSRVLSGEHVVHDDIVDFAKKKLAPDVTGEDATDSQLAALDVRLLLNFERSGIAMNKEADLVEGRMRIAYSVPKHRRYMYSGYPSEPVLGEAAAKCWAELSAANLSIPGLISGFMDNGYIGKGERGELVARLLLTLAYDAAVRQYSKHASQNPQDRQYTYPVPLELFLEKLFGRTHASTILGSYASVGAVPLGKAFGKAYIRFTHFIRAGDTSIATTSGAYASILRSSGIQCSSGQESIDIVIPIILGDEHTPLKESVVSGILISVKDRAKASPVAETDFDATALGFFPSAQAPYDGTEYGRPYIALVLELGVQPRASGVSDDVFGSKEEHTVVNPASSSSAKEGEKSGANMSEVRESPSEITSKTEPTRSNPARGGTSLKNPQYMIRVHGCSPTVYDVVTDKHLFALLLGSRTLLTEHARNSRPSLDAVMRMKPYWRVAEKCYHWLVGVQDRPLAQESHEGVYVTKRVAGDR